MRERTCFIDSDVFVNAFVILDKKKNSKTRELLDQLEQGKTNAITDYFVMAETYHVICKYKGNEKAIEIVKKLLTFNSLDIVSIDSYVFFEALKRAQRYHLKINDLIHFTVALLHNTSAICSYDKDFNGLEIKRIEP